MAVAERAFMQSYENSEYRYDYFSYSQGNSEHRREEAGEERKRIKRTRERPQPKTYTETNPQGLTGKELRLLMACLLYTSHRFRYIRRCSSLLLECRHNR